MSDIDSHRDGTKTDDPYRSARVRVLILGGGFGGLMTARSLDNRLRASDDVGILLVDRSNATLFTPLLWTVAEGRAGADNVVVPIRAFQSDRRFHVLHAEIEGIDLEARQVQTSAGSYPYDILVIALGSVTAIPPVPGLREYAMIFRTPADAIELRNHLIEAVEAAHRTEDSAERRRWLTFVVAGGGDTGVELAATIQDYVSNGLFGAYPWLEDALPRVVLVERMNRLTPMATSAVSDLLRRTLERQGIEVHLSTTVEGVTADDVLTSSGPIPTRTVFWAAGISVPEIVRQLPVEHAPNGAIMVDNCLRSVGRPEVYVVGDAAWAHDGATGAPVPPTAQAAGHEARYVARTIASELAGYQIRPYRHSSRGHLTLLGRHSGVAQVGRATLTGWPAWLLWHGYYLSHIPSWRNRSALGADWLLAALTGRDTAQLPLDPERQ